MYAIDISLNGRVEYFNKHAADLPITTIVILYHRSNATAEVRK